MNMESESVSDEPVQFHHYFTTELLELSQDIPKLVKLIPNMTKVQIENAIRILAYKDGCTKDQKIMIYDLIIDLLLNKEYIYRLPIILKDNEDFKTYISKFIAESFNSSQSERLRTEVLSKLIYKEFRSEFHTDSYNITQQHLIRECKLYNHLINLISFYYKELIKFNATFSHRYLYQKTIAPFTNGPVALLFSSGYENNLFEHYADELNCCILSHHLYEMGYSKENIMCFIEGKVFETDLFPFEKGQIHVSHDKVLCSYEIFRTKFRYLVFTKEINTSYIFEYAIIKAVVDAKGPVLIYFTHHGCKYSIFFPYSPNIYFKESFQTLCESLDNFEKNILFIFDCDGSEEFIPSSQFRFVHFITSSINYKDEPNLCEESVSFSTMSYKSIDKGLSISLSSQFTRHLLDSIYMIKPETTLIEFVAFINQGCVGYKAKLNSQNPLFLVSKFLQSPKLKYFNYLDLPDNYQQKDIRIFVENNDVKCETTHFITENGIIDIDNKEKTITNLTYWNDSNDESKITLKDEFAISIISRVVEEFVGFDNLERKKMYNKFPYTLYTDPKNRKLFNWFMQKFNIDNKALEYAEIFIPVYFYNQNKVELIEKFILGVVKREYQLHYNLLPVNK